MEIPLNAKVECVDGTYGESTCVIINPITKKVTHFVVRGKGLHSRAEHLVPVEQVAETKSRTIRLACSRKELSEMEPFVKKHYIKGKRPDPPDSPSDFLYIAPYVIDAVLEEPGYASVKEECIPPGELAVHRGAKVEATDGHVGQVGEFLVDPISGHISHIVLMEGHLWGRKEITIPVSTIDYVSEDRVHVKLNKQAIEALPAIRIKRHYGKINEKQPYR